MNEGGFLRMPNDWIDRAMPSMSAAEWMVTTVILRQTIGWNKDRDAISLTQFEQKTGLSRHTIIDAIRKLAKRGWIRVYEQGIRSVYEPSFEAGAISAPMDTSAETAPALVQKLHQTSAESAPEVVQKLHTQKTRKTKTKTDKDTKVHDALRARVPDESKNHSGDANKKVSKASRATLSTEEQARHKELFDDHSSGDESAAIHPPQEDDPFAFIPGVDDKPAVAEQKEKPAEKRQRKSKAVLTPEEQARHRELFDAVAQVCVLDAKMNGGIIARTAKQLRTGDAAAHAADVHAFLEWWKTSDFRGRQGSPPTPFQLTGSWKKFRDGYADIPKPTDNRQTKKPQITDMLSMLGGIYKEKNGN